MLCLWFSCLPKSHFHVLILQQEQHHMAPSNREGSAQGWSQCRACILNKLCRYCSHEKMWNRGNKSKVFKVTPLQWWAVTVYGPLLEVACTIQGRKEGVERRDEDLCKSLCTDLCRLCLFKQSGLKVSHLLHWTQFIVRNKDTSLFFSFLLPCHVLAGMV